MKLINPSFEIIKQLPGEEGIYKQIELAGRVCWKSENKITEDSYKNFIEMLKSKQHLSVLEHGTVYLQSLGVFLDPEDTDVAYGNYLVSHYIHNPYSKVKIIHNEEWKANVYITTNYRVLVENNWLSDLRYLCKPTEHHQKRITVRFILDRAIANEFVRHRVFSFAQESTRYCNYSKDKFGGECTFIMPSWFPYIPGNWGISETEDYWGNYNGTIITLNDKNVEHDVFKEDREHFKAYITSLKNSEHTYFNLLRKGWTPQQARSILPNSLKTELVMTGFVDDWKHFFELRCTSSAHPQARELAEPLYSEFIKRGYFNEKNY